MKGFAPLPLLLLLLCFWQLQEGVQACTCLPEHPQEVYCRSDVVIRAKVVGVSKGGPGFFDSVKYHLDLIRVFKGPKKYYDAIYTASSSAACGVYLEVDVEYLLMASLRPDGTLFISSCDYFQPWKSLTTTQKKLLKHYPKGCACTITPCYSLPCIPTKRTECMWSDFAPIKPVHGNQATNYACIKRNWKGFCVWKSPKVFVDIISARDVD
ncbi:metalloproteinase inhibitor 2-like [Syngnathoides biaculeatus]|uniref:metalloproteinase inhibitor 2-like n=1 Tax=Syngnathoides biaculeatus TaxID=300417 RepID=UPI002ADDA0D1|nr:metalloproteinase inhibitor 2-like [Syngnathoides biaculeatus]XP_061703158.1 metalloproteinase inhibitor 2-like [Syngnathoides biaculeatus]